MPESRTEQIVREIIEIVADEMHVDKNVVKTVIDHQFSFVKKCMFHLKDVRILGLGMFILKPKYKNMLKEYGYVYKFKGTFRQFKQQMEEDRGYHDRMEKLGMEKSRDREARKSKDADLRKLPYVQHNRIL